MEIGHVIKAASRTDFPDAIPIRSRTNRQIPPILSDTRAGNKAQAGVEIFANLLVAQASVDKIIGIERQRALSGVFSLRAFRIRLNAIQQQRGIFIAPEFGCGQIHIESDNRIIRLASRIAMRSDHADG